MRNMAATSKITVRVTSTRGGSTISYSTNGRYVSTQVNGFARDLTGQPIQPTSTQAAFWLAVLGAVTADLTANPNPP